MMTMSWMTSTDSTAGCEGTTVRFVDDKETG